MRYHSTNSLPSTSSPVAFHDVVEVDGAVVVLNGTTALSGVDLTVGAGAITAVTGTNGAGKTTLLEVLAGVRALNEGRLVRHLPTVGLVPQRAEVPDRLPLTVHDVVSMGTWGDVGAWGRVGSERKRRVTAALELLALDRLARRPFAQLSGGQRQRALLAQGLVRRADLLLLDEPTTGLDAESAELVGSALREVANRGAAVVCATHNQSVVALADRVVLLEAGRVKTDTGSPRHVSAVTSPR